MKPRPLLERPAHPRKIPHVLLRLKCRRRILWPQNPRVVRQPPRRVRPRIGIHQLPRRRHPDRIRIERERLRILDEMKNVRVAARKLRLAVHAERVVPDHPAPAAQPQLPLKEHLQLRRKIIPDRQPERPRRLERRHQRRPPLLRPLQILIRRHPVFIHVIVIPNIERRIRKRQVDRPRRQLPHPLDAIPVIQTIKIERH